MPDPRFDSPDAALAAAAGRLSPVGVERIPPASADGRALAEPVRLDRDSPAGDLSAMDGFALRRADLRPGRVPVAGEAVAGAPPPACPAGVAVRINTGAPLPAGAELVVKREDVREEGGALRVPDPPPGAPPGANVRRRGENGRAGDVLIPAGTLLTPAALAGVAACGAARVTVRRRVRVAVLVTGDEVLAADDPGAAGSGGAPPLPPWRVRDSNGPAVAALLGRRAFLTVAAPAHVPDEPAALAAALGRALSAADAVVLTGGVSVGDRDHVAAAVAACGGRILFRRLPIRPGKPVLAATAGGTLILGLPGNPVAALCTARRVGVPLLGRLAGLTDPDPAVPVLPPDPADRPSPLYRLRLACVGGAGVAWTPHRGPGDAIALARSDGFVELPPDRPPGEPVAFRAW